MFMSYPEGKKIRMNQQGATLVRQKKQNVSEIIREQINCSKSQELSRNTMFDNTNEAELS